MNSFWCCSSALKRGAGCDEDRVSLTARPSAAAIAVARVLNDSSPVRAMLLKPFSFASSIIERISLSLTLWLLVLIRSPWSVTRPPSFSVMLSRSSRR